MRATRPRSRVFDGACLSVMDAERLAGAVVGSSRVFPPAGRRRMPGRLPLLGTHGSWAGPNAQEEGAGERRRIGRHG
jgi:hypothetical protein